MTAGWYVPDLIYLSVFDDRSIDWLACHVCIRDFELGLFPLEGHSISRDWKCGRNSDWYNNHLRRFSLCLGHW